jgi:diadenosine tetraphosphate (Ap4A) HIT family hydrolase
MCDMAAAATPEQVIYDDDAWTAQIAPGADVPGWVLVRAKRHVEGLWDLSDDEAASLGPLHRKLAGAIRGECAAERVYVMSMGEHAAHFHTMLFARAADVPVEWRSAALLEHRVDLADHDEAMRVAARLREAVSAAGRKA